jgi:tRNA 2-(methylsulfanyl)-N6-isopentenyladenosine37 hydroxylase
MPTEAINITDLPLRYTTCAKWAARALQQPLKLLNDHAHLEKKAANNALELLNRWPGLGVETLDSASTPHSQETTRMTDFATQWAQTMTAVARDEIDHLGIVLRILIRRGGHFSKSHTNPYAKGLRELIRIGAGPAEVLDRLLVSALIELRSCERFAVLATELEQSSTDPELAKLYADLWISERGHYTVFLNLAKQLPSLNDASQALGDVEVRWDHMLDREAALIASQPTGIGMHWS